jgi:hypothetical protein
MVLGISERTRGQFMPTIFATHMFWAYGNFSNIEKLCVNSFVKNGYELNIWTYDDISNVPAGAIVRDAREVIPESHFFVPLGGGTPAAFSDYFRYAVLNLMGGLYVDTDVVAVKRVDFLPREQFLVTERAEVKGIEAVIKRFLLRRQYIDICNNVIFNPTPSHGNIIDLAFSYSQRFPREKITRAELGPPLLTAIERIYPDHGFSIKPPEFANSIDYWKCPAALLTPGFKLHTEAVFVHLYTETWRSAKVDKNVAIPKPSLMSFLAGEYL